MQTSEPSSFLKQTDWVKNWSALLWWLLSVWSGISGYIVVSYLWSRNHRDTNTLRIRSISQKYWKKKLLDSSFSHDEKLLYLTLLKRTLNTEVMVWWQVASRQEGRPHTGCCERLWFDRQTQPGSDRLPQRKYQQREKVGKSVRVSIYLHKMKLDTQQTHRWIRKTFWHSPPESNYFLTHPAYPPDSSRRG